MVAPLGSNDQAINLVARKRQADLPFVEETKQLARPGNKFLIFNRELQTECAALGTTRIIISQNEAVAHAPAHHPGSSKRGVLGKCPGRPASSLHGSP
jgi:hypothetical protein